MASAGVSLRIRLLRPVPRLADFPGRDRLRRAPRYPASCHFTPPGHTTAPHPPAPWIGGGIVSHTTHLLADRRGRLLPVSCRRQQLRCLVLVSAKRACQPGAPTPDCFNNTLCHGGSVDPPDAAGAAYSPYRSTG